MNNIQEGLKSPRHSYHQWQVPEDGDLEWGSSNGIIQKSVSKTGISFFWSTCLASWNSSTIKNCISNIQTQEGKLEGVIMFLGFSLGFPTRWLEGHPRRRGNCTQPCLAGMLRRLLCHVQCGFSVYVAMQKKQRTVIVRSVYLLYIYIYLLMASSY